MKGLHKKKKWVWAFLAIVLLFAVATAVANEIAANQGQTIPAYKKEPITETIEKLSDGQQLSTEEIKFLYQQTGLGGDALTALASRGKTEKALDYQEALFRKNPYHTVTTNIFTGEEALTAEEENLLPFVDLQTGDVLITSAAHTLGWRHGHCGLVVNGEEGQILEAFTIGQPSEICSLGKWLRYPNVIQLRPKSRALGELAASYGKEHLNHLPYSLFSDFQNDGEITVTHCSHLIRMSYLPYGVELKEGLIVTPKDIAHSDDFYVVQVRGMDPTTLWN